VGRAAAALIQRRDETGTLLHYLQLLLEVAHFTAP
jgi:hypothetical protein